MESGKHALQGTVVSNKIPTNINTIITKKKVYRYSVRFVMVDKDRDQKVN